MSKRRGPSFNVIDQSWDGSSLMFKIDSRPPTEEIFEYAMEEARKAMKPPEGATPLTFKEDPEQPEGYRYFYQSLLFNGELFKVEGCGILLEETDEGYEVEANCVPYSSKLEIPKDKFFVKEENADIYVERVAETSTEPPFEFRIEFRKFRKHIPLLLYEDINGRRYYMKTAYSDRTADEAYKYDFDE